MNKQEHKIFEPTGCITEQTMYDYIDKKLTSPEEHLVEKHLLDCDLCSDAIEGLSHVKDRKRVAHIRSEIDIRIQGKKETRIILFNYRTVTAIAASLALLTGAVIFFKFYANKEAKNADMAILQPAAEEKESATPIEQSPNMDSIHINNGLTSASGQGNATEPYKTTKDAAEYEETTVVMEDAAGAGIKDETKIAQTITTKGSTDDMDKYYSGNNEQKKSEVLKADEKSKVGDAETEGTFAWTTTAENDNQNKLANNKNNNTPTATLPQSAVAKDEKAVVMKEESNQAYRKEKETRNDKGKTKKRSISAKQESPAFEGQKTTPQSQTQPSTGTFADITEVADSVFIYDLPEVPAQFPGGEQEFIKYISKNFNPPLLNKTDQINTTKMYAQFIIDREGNIQNIKITKSIHPSYDAEMIRVLKAMPKWIPAKQNGKTVNSRINYPIQIELK